MRSRQRHAASKRDGPSSTEPSSANAAKASGRSSAYSFRLLFLGAVSCILWIGRPAKLKRPLPTQETQVIKQPPTFNNPEQPTDRACDGYAGIYHIQSGDVGGAAATIFFQFVIAQLIYAEDHNLKPWVFFNNISHHVYDRRFHNATGPKPTLQFTMMDGMNVEHQQDPRLRRAAYPGKPYVGKDGLQSHLFEFTGDGVWDNYFEPVSDFVPGDTSCTSKPLVTMDIWSITPGLHIYAPWTPRMWRYDVLPDYMQQRHKTLREWLTPQRLKAHQITQQYIRVQPSLWAKGDQLVDSSTNCVGMHIRWSDKGGGRRLIEVDEFLPYVERFLAKGGNCIFVATDSGKVLDHIAQNWTQEVRSVLRSQGDNVIRSNDEIPVFEKRMTSNQQLVSHHRTNQEVLVDILALSKCAFLLHGHSAVSDAAMYLNEDLIYQSVNLEDPEDFSLDEFGDLVDDVLLQKTGVDHSRFFPRPWWMRTAPAIQVLSQTKTQGCEGYLGVLHIAIGGGEEFSFGMTFFHFILNQLLFADMYNLKPWVHLAKDGTAAVYDARVHGSNSSLSFQMLTGAVPKSVSRSAGSEPDAQQPSEEVYPGSIVFETTLTKNSVSVEGNGVWNSYFEPVSDFDPSSAYASHSCQNKPLVTLDRTMVSSGLHKWAPWSVRAFKFSGMPDDLWWSKAAAVASQSHSLSEWLFPMRKKANDVVKKYFRAHPFIWKRVQEVNPIATRLQDSTINTGNTGESPSCCLAVHIRQGDKENYGKRKTSRIRDYKPFIEAFLTATNRTTTSTSASTQPFVYLATDAWRVLDALAENWPESLKSRIRTQGDRVVRSVRWVPAHLLEPDNHHRVNLEALVDILAMSKCQFLLHGSSTMSEAAIYLNLLLHNKSVNLDDPGHLSAEEFESLVRRSGLCI